MRSLRARLVLALAAVIGLLMVLAGLALERAFREAARSALEERLSVQLYVLMAAAESEEGRLTMPPGLAEYRLSFPGSGLSARVFDESPEPVWQSPSAVDALEPAPVRLPPGERRFDKRVMPDGSAFLVAAFGVYWATGPDPRSYTFAVAEDLKELKQETAGFRATLYRWLGVMSAVVLVALALALRWGLGPLREVAAELKALEAGERERIQGVYPSELKPLTDNLNALLAHERARQERLDHALGDLAHSLKTPLAVLRGALDGPGLDAERGRLLGEQVERMGTIVEYQLRRARAGALQAGRLAPPVALHPVAERLAATMQKVFRDKPVALVLHVPDECAFRGSEEDLMEVLGNLLENAFKWCRGRVELGAVCGPAGLEIRVDDDGPGIPPELAQSILERGARADESAPGHGLGLAVVRAICAAYGGSIGIESSAALGGASVRVRLGGD